MGNKNGDHIDAPIVSPYNDNIRPLLNAIDKLRHLITSEGIQLPTIVVIGDQSSGKSSVLESLAGINLPRGQGICTRVPLIMRLQHTPSPHTELFLEFNNKIVSTNEKSVSEAINLATEEITGKGKGISNTPLTLVVNKKGVPDLTMVDLPCITRVPVHGQPENIYDQIKGIIMEYITPKESIILNVLSATVDFPTCESIRMSQSVDKTGKRTLAVVTKVDKAPEGLREKVSSDDVNIGLGYTCVRNHIGEESYEEARKEEAKLFSSHPQLSKLDKSIVGIPALAQRLVEVQAASIGKSLPGIVKNINDKLNTNAAELRAMPKQLSLLSEATTTFIQIVGMAKESLRKILLRGEFNEYRDNPKMHCTARLVEMLEHYSDDLYKCEESDMGRDFLMEEIMVLEESKMIELPNFLPRSAFLMILERKIEGISYFPINFMVEVWDYVEDVVTSVLKRCSENYYHLHLSIISASHSLIERMKERSINWVSEIVEMEKLTGYTYNPEYSTNWDKLMNQRESFASGVLNNRGGVEHKEISKIAIEDIGEIEVWRDVGLHSTRILMDAFDLKMRMVAYWKIVLGRLIDGMALHLQLSLEYLLRKELEKEVVEDFMAPERGGVQRMMEESPIVAAKRSKLTKSIELLKESKEVLAKSMDKITSYNV
ncbi:dynamin-related protein 4C-like [Malania oleifera]|uniref:dynamin-related protein 4C-like n=1 Tax=Malania oleifera TaxID=397392 RepID=UPI0025AE5F38|nr:dynamin-related protein 4C-like [Malania oleifera]